MNCLELVALPLNARRRGGRSVFVSFVACRSALYRSMQCCNALHYGVDTACVLFYDCVCAPLVIGDLEPAKNGLIPHEPQYLFFDITSSRKGKETKRGPKRGPKRGSIEVLL